MTCAMVLYVCLGTPAGYVSARIYKSFGGEKWKSNVLLTSMLSPGYDVLKNNIEGSIFHFSSNDRILKYFLIVSPYRIVFSLFFILNLIFWANRSSAAVPFSTLVALLALWFGVSVPLTFVGAYFGFRKRVNIRFFLLGHKVEKNWVFYSNERCNFFPASGTSSENEPNTSTNTRAEFLHSGNTGSRNGRSFAIRMYIYTALLYS